MEKFATILLTWILLGTYAMTNPSNNNKLCLGKEKVTKLRFYLQDFIGGQNRTVYEIARTNQTVKSELFGFLYILDNPVTIGPEMESGEVGRMQGFVGLSDFNQLSLTMLLNIVFTDGEFNGSTISLLGRNPLSAATREVSVVSGTGVFRLARGYALTSTYRKDVAGIHDVYEYNVVLVHFDIDASIVDDSDVERNGGSSTRTQNSF